MQSYADRVLRLTVRLEQLSRTASKDMQVVLRRLRKEVLAILLDDKVATKTQLIRIRKEIRDVSIERYQELDELLFEHQSATAAAAHKLEKESFAALGVSGAQALELRDVPKIVSRSFDIVMPGGSGRQMTVREMWSRYTSAGINDASNIATRAYLEGLPVAEITELVRDASGVQERSAEALARTLIQATANQAREETAEALDVDRAIWMATLDSSTCAYCQGLDGQCREKNKFAGLAHINCRCVRIYVPPGMSCGEMKQDLGRVQRGDSGRSEKLDKYLNYGEWIKTQSATFQEEALGKERARLLRDGKITFDKMYTDAGRRLTVADIKEKYL